MQKLIISFPVCRAAFSGTALAFRDRLVIDWNQTQQSHTFADQKRVYCKFYSSIPDFIAYN